MSRKDFEFLEHTADLRFRSYGKTLDVCFENAARAMFLSVVDPNSVSVTPAAEKKLNIRSDGLETLLHDFLAEILFIFETEGLVFREFSVSVKKDGKDGGYHVSARLGGEKFDPEKHVILSDIKAVTYHEIRVEKKDERWVSEVLCDV